MESATKIYFSHARDLASQNWVIFFVIDLARYKCEKLTSFDGDQIINKIMAYQIFGLYMLRTNQALT